MDEEAARPLAYRERGARAAAEQGGARTGHGFGQTVLARPHGRLPSCRGQLGQVSVLPGPRGRLTRAWPGHLSGRASPGGKGVGFLRVCELPVILV